MDNENEEVSNHEKTQNETDASQQEGRGDVIFEEVRDGMLGEKDNFSDNGGISDGKEFVNGGKAENGVTRTSDETEEMEHKGTANKDETNKQLIGDISVDEANNGNLMKYKDEQQVNIDTVNNIDEGAKYEKESEISMKLQNKNKSDTKIKENTPSTLAPLNFPKMGVKYQMQQLSSTSQTSLGFWNNPYDTELRGKIIACNLHPNCSPFTNRDNLSTCFTIGGYENDRSSATKGVRSNIAWLKNRPKSRSVSGRKLESNSQIFATSLSYHSRSGKPISNLKSVHLQKSPRNEEKTHNCNTYLDHHYTAFGKTRWKPADLDQYGYSFFQTEVHENLSADAKRFFASVKIHESQPTPNNSPKSLFKKSQYDPDFQRVDCNAYLGKNKTQQINRLSYRERSLQPTLRTISLSSSSVESFSKKHMMKKQLLQYPKRSFGHPKQISYAGDHQDWHHFDDHHPPWGFRGLTPPILARRNPNGGMEIEVTSHGSGPAWLTDRPRGIEGCFNDVVIVNSITRSKSAD